MKFWCACDLAHLPSEDSSSAPAEKEDTDGRWKFRVRTIKQNEVNADAKLLPKQQKKMLESSVKDGLEKAGVDTGSEYKHIIYSKQS